MMYKFFRFVLITALLLSPAGCTNVKLETGIDSSTSPVPEFTLEVNTFPISTATFPPPSEFLVSEGDYALFMGDFVTAQTIFQNVITQTTDPEIKAQAEYGLGLAFLSQDEISLALNHFRQAALSSNLVTAIRAQYQLGKIYTQLQRYDEALTAYQIYLDSSPGLIDEHIHELRGDLFVILGDYPSAIASFQEAYLAHPSGGTDNLAIKIARAFQSNGDDDTALTLFWDIYNTSINDYTKAQMALFIGNIYLKRHDTEQAYEIFQASIEQFPFAYDAYTALVILVDHDVPVNEYFRGLINYYVGNYLLAIQAFDRYLEDPAAEDADAALYYQGLSMRAQGGNNAYEKAINNWETLIEDHPTSPYYIEAWEEIEFTYWAYLDDPRSAAEASMEFVLHSPDASKAPGFLFKAGRSYERANLLQEAIDAWERIGREYPQSEDAFLATYFAGITHVRMGDWSDAQNSFSRALMLTTEPSEQAAAYLWIGKSQHAQGDYSAALDTWKLAQTTNPFGYYSIRAEDLLIGRGPFSEPAIFELNTDLNQYLPQAETWVRSSFGISSETNLESPGLLAYEPRFRRGLEFWALGDYASAKTEFEIIRQTYAEDPLQTFRLIPTLVEIGLYRTALVASTQLLRLAGLEKGAALSAPEYFSRVRFGAYYLDLVQAAADSKGISPLLLLSVMRQESAYDSLIYSGAGAIGLMQIMPATGAQIAENLHWPNAYTVSDLKRPYVNIPFGASYLRQQKNLFDDDIFAMLAAYNGGPGNTLAWAEMTPFNDPDLFLEIIRIEETRNYIRLVNEIHYIYGWLYGKAEDW